VSGGRCVGAVEQGMEVPFWCATSVWTRAEVHGHVVESTWVHVRV
jgi:hypothetical protein